MKHELGIVCIHVLHGERPILLVSKDDGEVSYACGRGDHRTDVIDDWAMAHLVHFAHDPALGITHVLRDGECAERVRVGAPWLRGVLPPR